MPIYEFQCQACGVEIEVLQKINDPHLTDCEACGKSEMKKKVTAAAFRLSGAGWYETDFKKENDKKKNLTDTASDSNKEKKSADTTKASKDNSDKGGDKASIKTDTSTKESSKPKKDKAPSTD
ncbi:MAG: zinc ribbon domain-containing protein [Cocleimonas sp.]